MEELASFVRDPARSGSEPAPMIAEGPLLYLRVASVEAIATEAAASSVAQTAPGILTVWRW